MGTYEEESIGLLENRGQEKEYLNKKFSVSKLYSQKIDEKQVSLSHF